MIDILSLTIGAALGTVGAFLLLRSREVAAYERGKGAATAQISQLEERLQARDRDIETLQTQRGQDIAEIKSLQISLRAEEQRRATAEEKAGRIQSLDAQIGTLREELKSELLTNSELTATISRLETTLDKERSASAEKLALLDEAREKLAEAFKALSSDALNQNNTSFLELAKATFATQHEASKGELEKRHEAFSALVVPVRETLERFDKKIVDLEKAREGAYQGLTEQVRGLLDSQRHLRSETTKLVQALRSPIARGRWGEIQLKRVVELAGMLNHCDFFEQETTSSDEQTIRPDLRIQLPGGKSVIVDAKAPLTAYLEAFESADEDTRRTKMTEHASQIRKHVATLSRKAYWDQFESTPEFVILFLPGEHFFGAALEQDPTLIETSVEQRILIATPTTLIALLKAVAYGWRQEQVEKNAQEISNLGRELYRRLATMTEHWERVGKHLSQATSSYNSAVASLEARVLPSARRFKELQAASGAPDIDALTPVEATVRELQAPELTSV